MEHNKTKPVKIKNGIMCGHCRKISMDGALRRKIYYCANCIKAIDLKETEIYYAGLTRPKVFPNGRFAK